MAERRKDVLDEILIRLDDTCGFILAGITMHPEGIGFNKLHKEIKKYPKPNHYNKMAKTTLSLHIQHLIEEKLITNDPKNDSRLKIKPSKYQISPYFKELSKGIIAQALTPIDYLPLMRAEDASTVTVNLMDVNIILLSECLEAVLQAPENIAIFNIHQTFYNLETLMRAYRERILEKKEEKAALKTIQEWVAKYRKIAEKSKY